LVRDANNPPSRERREKLMNARGRCQGGVDSRAMTAHDPETLLAETRAFNA
jgi:hypothetical protein